MIAYHCNTNKILHATFANRKDKHRIAVYNSIMTRLAKSGHTVNRQILDNKFSAEYKRIIEEKWKATYQIVPPNVHHRNIAERAIFTFKAHFLSILAGVDPEFPKFMWDKLLDQTEITLNLLRQTTLNLRISAWEFFNVPFDFIETHLGPIGYKVIIHERTNTQKSWYQRGQEGYNIDPAIENYQYFSVIDKQTKELRVSDTV